VSERPGRSKKAGRSPNKVVPIHEGAEPVRASLDGTDGVARTRTAVVLGIPSAAPRRSDDDD
jgi:hypothetical protein